MRRLVALAIVVIGNSALGMESGTKNYSAENYEINFLNAQYKLYQTSQKICDLEGHLGKATEAAWQVNDFTKKIKELANIIGVDSTKGIDTQVKLIIGKLTIEKNNKDYRNAIVCAFSEFDSKQKKKNT